MPQLLKADTAARYGVFVEEVGTTKVHEVDEALRDYNGNTSVVRIEIEFVQVGQATLSVSIIISFALTLGLTVGGICGAGSVPNSQHQHCNAVDLFAPSYAVLVSAFSAMLGACRQGWIPCAELIGPGPVGKGQIATKAGGWSLHTYTGPNSHQGHIHASGDPLM